MESSNVNKRKKMAEKLVIQTFRVVTQLRACRRAVPARYRKASESKTTPVKANKTKMSSAKTMIGTAEVKSKNEEQKLNTRTDTGNRRVLSGIQKTRNSRSSGDASDIDGSAPTVPCS